MSKQLPFVSVIIPSYHDWERLFLCLAALQKQSYPTDRFEILVVNNDPNDSPSYPVERGNVRLLSEAKPGSYAARNAGIILSKGEILAFTDSDCIPDVKWIANAVEALQNGVQRVAGHIKLFYQSNKLTWVETYEKAFGFRQEQNARNGVSVTANLLVWKNYFDEVGLFDETLFSTGDFEWSSRASKRGISIEYCPNVIVSHPARSSLTDIKKKQRAFKGEILN